MDGPLGHSENSSFYSECDQKFFRPSLSVKYFLLQLRAIVGQPSQGSAVSRGFGVFFCFLGFFGGQ